MIYTFPRALSTATDVTLIDADVALPSLVAVGLEYTAANRSMFPIVMRTAAGDAVGRVEGIRVGALVGTNVGADDANCTEILRTT